jgi:hypothetical protein
MQTLLPQLSGRCHTIMLTRRNQEVYEKNASAQQQQQQAKEGATQHHEFIKSVDQKHEAAMARKQLQLDLVQDRERLKAERVELQIRTAQLKKE